jgi:hypothetical protein
VKDERVCECSGEHSGVTWRRSFGIAMRQLRAIRCAIEYQGIATRTHATTREILVHRSGAMLLLTE